MTNGSEHDFKPYYNVPLPTAASDAPSSLSSECTSEEPARPPRTCDSGNKVPSYCNLPENGRGEGEGEPPMQPPMLPRRQPHLRASPVALRGHPTPPLPPPPPPPPPPPSTALTSRQSQQQQQHVFNFPPPSSSKFSCASTASTASPTPRLPTYQNYRKRSSVVGRSRTLAGTPRRGAPVAVGGCQCGKLGTAAAAAAASEAGKFDERWGKSN